MDEFAYLPVSKTLEDFPDLPLEMTRSENVQVAFIQAETEDEGDRLAYVETKLVKNLKWVAKKNNASKVILHSFAHLSESKADPHITKQLFDQVQARMQTAGYDVSQTPFGYFLNLDIQAPGNSLARVFKSF